MCPLVSGTGSSKGRAVWVLQEKGDDSLPPAWGLAAGSEEEAVKSCC